MKRILLTVFLLLNTIIVFCQKVDTVIKKEAYYSYYSYTVKNPLYVVYHLYQGGGDCSRKSMNFVGDSGTATNNDYKKQGYDKGHLANAEDFANDCEKEKSTFSYYNCQPQTPRLNRGIWKVWETKIRKESQLKHLEIICGGIFTNSTFIGDGVYVPTYCWKMVINEEDGTIEHCLLFPNDNSDSFQEISLPDLKEKLEYVLSY
ncbi:MAG: DNA/RNA non-specific endonuclease [Bacteroidota bacterium]